MASRRTRLVLALLACLLLPLEQAAARAFTDDAGRTVELPDHVGRILAAGPPASILVYSLAPEKLLGWTRALDPPARALLPPAFADLPAIGRLTGRGNTASLENVVALKPDLIVDAGTIDPTYVSLADKMQAQTGIPYILLDGRLEDSPATFRRLGQATGDPAAAARLADYAARVLADAARLRAATKEKPAVYYGRGPDGLETGLAGSINVELLDLLGARNVAGEGGHGGLARVSLEQLIAWDPAVILAEDPRFLATLRADPRYSEIAAVRANRLYLTPSLPFGWFDSPPGVNRLLGVDWLASVLDPASAPPSDLRRKVLDFFDLFYHRRPGEAELRDLLGPVPSP